MMNNVAISIIGSVLLWASSTVAQESVKVSIFEEGLCPSCIGWFSGAFGPGTGAWNAYMTIGDGADQSIMDMDLIEWGNAQGSPDTDSFSCQHGAVECSVMKYQNCVKGLHSNDQYLQFVHCFDDILMQTFPSGLPSGIVNETFAEASIGTCAKSLNLNYNDLKKCVSDDGQWKTFVTEAKNATPAHSAVPFIILNGTTSMPPPKDLIGAVCAVYQASGGSHPNCSNSFGMTKSSSWTW